MGAPKVLVVDDDAQVRRTVVRLLEGWCEVSDAPGGTEALELLRRGLRPDLVVSDVDMPMVDGPSLFRSSLEERLLPREAFVFMSGSQTGEKISFLVREGVLVLEKPFRRDHLLSAIEGRLSDQALTRLRSMRRIIA